MTIALDAFPFHLLDPGINAHSPDASIEAQRRLSVVSKRDSGRVNLRSNAREKVHPLVSEMVRDQEQQLGRRMPAYAAVGEWIGVKPTWVRRLIGRQEVPVTGDRLLLIVAAYRNHCARVEQRAVESRAATARRWEDIDALLHGLGEPNCGSPGLAAEPGGDDLGASARAGVRS